jgi:outer membrane protein assembly factor BamB
VKSLKAQRTRSLLGASLFLLLAIIGCSGSATPIDVHGFSNLVLKDDTLWFGAGYKLYRVDLNQQTAKVVYDTDDVVITFVEIDEESLFFGGHHSPNGSEGVIWSLDINSETIVWEKNIQDNWWRGRIVASPLIDQDTVIVAMRQVLYGLDKASGDSKWKIENNWFGTGELLTPILANGYIFYGVNCQGSTHR